MRKNVMLVMGLVAVFGMSAMIAGCSSKPSCKLLYKRYKKCKKMPLTEDAFISRCDKLADKPRIKEEVKCSAKSDCDDFKKCLKQADKIANAARMKKRWKKVMDKASKGKYSSALSFCRVWKDEMSDDLKEKCKGLPVKAVAALTKEITANRDAGKISHKHVKCWDLKRIAKKAGAAHQKKAELLCKEIALARDAKTVLEKVAKNLKKGSPSLPYYCYERQLKKYEKLGTPFAKKTVGVIVNACYKKLGLYILQKKVPKMKYGCYIKDLYKGIQKYKITGPKIDELMKEAAKLCDKKK